MKTYNKLVRDRIPQIIEAAGGKAYTRTLCDAEYRESLEKKLDEEVAEYHADGDIMELADILEVVFALCQAEGFTVDALMSAYRNKHDERGGFDRRTFLIGVDEGNHMEVPQSAN